MLRRERKATLTTKYTFIHDGHDGGSLELNGKHLLTTTHSWWDSRTAKQRKKELAAATKRRDRLMAALKKIEAHLERPRIQQKTRDRLKRDRRKRKSDLKMVDEEIRELTPPFRLGEDRATGRTWWFLDGEIYSTVEDDLEPEDVAALIGEQQNKKRLKLARAKTIAAMAANLDKAPQRVAIPREVKLAVWQRDGGQCVQCGSNRDLEFDHVIPLSVGGANTDRNLQLLCSACNRAKGASV